jgi:hypothetical protein
MEKEYVASIRYASGATESLAVDAKSVEEAKERLASMYPNATINWILPEA